MAGLARRFLAVLGVIALIAVCAVIYVTVFLDPNDFKPRVINAVKQHTGLELTLNGPIAWTFYPRLGVSAEDVDIRLPQQSHESPDFATFGRVEVTVQFLPLLKRHISIDGVTIDHPHFELERDVNGIGNWENAGRKVPSGIVPSSDVAVDNTDSPHHVGIPSDDQNHDKQQRSSRFPLSLALSNVQIRQGSIHYVDHSSARDSAAQESDKSIAEVTLSRFNMNASRVGFNSFFPFDIGFDVTSPMFQQGHVNLKGQMDTTSGVPGHYDIKHILLDGQGIIPGLARETMQRFTLNASSLNADLYQHQYQMSDAAFNTLLYPDALKGKVLPLNVNVSAHADMGEQQLVVDRMEVKSDDQIDLTASLLITGLSNSLHYSGQLSMDHANMRQWLGNRGITLGSMADDNALGRVDLNATIDGDRSQLTLDGITGKVDHTSLDGRVVIGLAEPIHTFDLHAGKLDLDKYLPPEHEKSSSEDGQQSSTSSGAESTENTPVLPNNEGDTSSSGTSANPLPAGDNKITSSVEPSSAEPPSDNASSAGGATGNSTEQESEHLPLAFLKRSTINGMLTVDELQIRRVKFGHVAINARNDHGQVMLDQLSAQGYGGTLNANGRADVRQFPLRMEFKPRLSDIVLGSLLMDYASSAAHKIDGKIDLQASLETYGDNKTSFLENLGGQGSVELVDGHLIGMDIPGQMCRAAAAITHHSAPSDNQSDTPIKRLDSVFAIRQGMLSVSTLNADLPGIKASGHGEVDVTHHAFDLPLSLSFSENETLQACGIPKKLAKVALPLHCSGDMDGKAAEWCRIDQHDLRKALKRDIGNELKRRIDKALDSEKGDKFKNILNGLIH